MVSSMRFYHSMALSRRIIEYLSLSTPHTGFSVEFFLISSDEQTKSLEDRSLRFPFSYCIDRVCHSYPEGKRQEKFSPRENLFISVAFDIDKKLSILLLFNFFFVSF